MSTKEAAREEAWKKSAAYRAVTEDGESYKARDYYREGFDAGYESARDQWTECPECKSGIADGYLTLIEERDSGGTRSLVGCPVCEHEWQQGGE